MIHRYIIEATDEVKGFEEAIEQLDREWGIEELEPCEDAISRQAVLALAKEECDTAIIPYRRFVKGINALLPVTPQPKTGHWKRNETIRLTYCSECGYGQHKDDSRTYCYCPNCGAKMEDKE